MTVTARELNKALARGQKRAADLEGPLADVLAPVLARAGREAARAFHENATDFLTAAAFRREALTAAAPASTSTMIALYPRPAEAQALAQPGGEEAGILHITLCYVGDTEEEVVAVLLDAMRPVAARFAPLAGTVGGVGSFGGEAYPNGTLRGPSIVLPDVYGLSEIRVAVTEALDGAGIDYSRLHGFCPHITLAYTEGALEAPPADLIGQPLHFDDLVVARGDVPQALPLTGHLALVAGAVTAETEVGQQLGDVAAAHAPDGGYGETAWNAEAGKVFWVSADWTTFDEAEAAEQAFLAVDAVEEFEECAECGLPEGDGWEVVYRSGASGLVADGKKKQAAGQPPPWSAPAPDEILDLAALVAALKGKLDPVRLAALETIVSEIAARVGISFDVTNPFVEKVLATTAAQVTAIADTTRADVMRVIAAAYQDGLSIPDTAARITEFMLEASTERAVMIARTELAGITNGGSLAAVQIVQSVTGDSYQKVWLTAPGARYPRHEDYEDLDHQSVGLADYFDVGGAQLQFPGDPAGPPEEVIQCRCAIAYSGGAGEPTSEGAVPDEG